MLEHKASETVEEDTECNEQRRDGGSIAHCVATRPTQCDAYATGRHAPRTEGSAITGMALGC